jgi:hypothetical protein
VTVIIETITGQVIVRGSVIAKSVDTLLTVAVIDMAIVIESIVKIVIIIHQMREEEDIKRR